MQWYEKFSIGQEVRVVRKVDDWSYGYGASWVDGMNQTINKVYKIIQIRTNVGFQLNTGDNDKWIPDYWYPAEALADVKGQQLLFNFMD